MLGRIQVQKGLISFSQGEVQVLPDFIVVRRTIGGIIWFGAVAYAGIGSRLMVFMLEV
jgi:hypothetical protein